MGDTSRSPPPLLALYSTSRGLYLRALEPSQGKALGWSKAEPRGGSPRALQLANRPRESLGRHAANPLTTIPPASQQEVHKSLHP